MTSTGKADLSIIIHRLSVDIRLTQVEINQEGETTVNALKPAGCTAADYAMDLTKTLVDQSKNRMRIITPIERMSKELLYFLQMESRITSLVLMSLWQIAQSHLQNDKKQMQIFTPLVYLAVDVSITGHSGIGLWSAKENLMHLCMVCPAIIRMRVHIRSWEPERRDSKGSGCGILQSSNKSR